MGSSFDGLGRWTIKIKGKLIPSNAHEMAEIMTRGNGQLRVGIVACEILKREIEIMTKDDPDIVHREYLEFALHIDSNVLKTKVQEKVNALKGQVDAVFLGYAICQSLRDVTKLLEVPTAMLEADDCIGAFITPMEYEREKRRCTGTWFSSPGWAELGIQGAVKELHLDSMVDQGYDPMYFMKMLFDGYARCLYVHTGVEDEAQYVAKSEDFAKQLNLRHECRPCDMRVLQKALDQTKALARKAVMTETRPASVSPAVTESP